MAGFGFGSFVFNFVSTAIVNPNHLEAGDNGYFSHAVADNVPKMIRTLCICWLSLSVIGIAMIFPYVEEKGVEKEEEKEKMIETSNSNSKIKT